MNTEVIEYLNSVGGNVFRSPSNRIWYKDPSGWEKEWERLSRDNACVYDFPATSSLFRYLIETAEVDFIDPAKSEKLKKGIRNRFLETDSRILHQLILHDKIYLNITNLIKENVNFDILKNHGIATEYPRALSKEYLGVYMSLKPLIMGYIEKLLKHAGIDDFSMFWRSGINIDAIGQQQQFLSYVYDEYAKLRCGEDSYFLSLLDLFTPKGNIRIGDMFEAAMDGLSPMLHDSMHMFTLAPQVHQQETSDFSKRRVADDTMVLFQIALGEEIGFTPRIESLRDVLRLRKDKRVSRYREVLSKFIQGIRNCDESKVREMGQEIRRAKKYLDNFEWMDSRPYLWATTAAGFVPVLGQIVGGATVALKEVRELVEKRHNWIYLGCK